MIVIVQIVIFGTGIQNISASNQGIVLPYALVRFHFIFFPSLVVVVSASAWFCFLYFGVLVIEAI